MNNEELLKLTNLRILNRQQGWRRTVDIIGQHILSTLEPLDFTVITRSQYEIKHNPLIRAKYKAIQEYIRRTQEALSIILYSFDDNPEEAVAAVRHLTYHWRLLDWTKHFVTIQQTMFKLDFMESEIWNHWAECVGVDLLDPEETIDSRFY